MYPSPMASLRAARDQAHREAAGISEQRLCVAPGGTGSSARASFCRRRTPFTSIRPFLPEAACEGPSAAGLRWASGSCGFSRHVVGPQTTGHLLSLNFN